MVAKKNTDERSLWERLENPAPSPRPSLSARKFAWTAVGIADAEGLDAITMRRLATELDVAPMAAYRYVAGKDEVLLLMGDLVYAELEIPEAGLGWREVHRLVALRTRELLLRHTWLARLPPEAVLTPSPNRLNISERCMASFDGLGIDADEKMAAYRTVDSFVGGAAGTEVAVASLMGEKGWASGDDVRGGLAPQMSYLVQSGRYPSFRAWSMEAVRKDDRAWQFELGLECVLDGLSARLGI
ncbi:TetR/AcrR family transcriptional regulator [Phytomonospora endophytica]|uniref:AcrR family transcriptional regulator n=1 Tax=Phytomonospora endophytica TaxID=714109 RepID=A0A841FRB8_9ACTN|nr:TetR/AcrR family transcriptional regulator C-terminal domain-containing protein [Phytomonospora endophytica]MBB6035099.1 AcrR family transcriptional regulator [Phytomonospora endophytica]GIG64152.1 TetR family transcriptional regulator [Phytomonospora endophytica]